MKKEAVCTAMAVIGVSLFFLYGNGKQRKVADDLMFENVEALARGENSSVRCWGSGSVICSPSQTKVAFVRERSLLY